MKKIQIPMVLLGLLSLLIPLGIAASYVLAVKYHEATMPSSITMAVASVPLIFGVCFVYIGIRLQKILYATPRVPIVTLRVWLVTTLALAYFRHTANMIGLGFVLGSYWYLAWALKKETGESE